MPKLYPAAARAVSPLPRRRVPVLEPLESRRMMSVGLDAAGWTVVKPEGDSRVIYVSNSKGNDANSGLTQSAPVKSLAKASSLLRNKTGDQMLLLRGTPGRRAWAS